MELNKKGKNLKYPSKASSFVIIMDETNPPRGEKKILLSQTHYNESFPLAGNNVLLLLLILLS